MKALGNNLHNTNVEVLSLCDMYLGGKKVLGLAHLGHIYRLILLFSSITDKGLGALSHCLPGSELQDLRLTNRSQKKKNILVQLSW